MPSLNYPIKENFFLGKIEEFSLKGLQALLGARSLAPDGDAGSHPLFSFE
jgi:hypothetical protein